MWIAIWSSVARIYLTVWSGVECPNIFMIVYISTPLRYIIVAPVRRAVCEDISSHFSAVFMIVSPPLFSR